MNVKRAAVIVLGACVTIQARAANIISLNLAENPANQVFAGGQAIGPLQTDSARWNSTIDRTSGTLASGAMDGLKDDSNAATGAGVVWNSSNTYWNGDGVGDDERKLSVGYLDDGGTGVSVTFTNVPYARYRVYGLCATDQNWPNSFAWRNWQVNGAWVFGGDENTTVSSYGGITPNYTAHGRNWTQTVPGSVIGNYWVALTSGATLTIQGLPRNGTARGTLTGVVVESVPLDWGVPAAPRTFVDGADVACQLLYAASTVTVVWAASDQGTGSIGDWTGAPGGGSAALGEVAAGAVASNRIAALASDRRVAFRFYGANADGADWSASASFDTHLTEAQQPVVTSLTVDAGTIRLAWEDRSQTESAFLVQWGAVGGATTGTVAVAAASFEQHLLEPGTTYAFRVGATNSANGTFTGYSAWTNGTIAAALPPAWGAPGVADTAADGATVTCQLQQASAQVWVAWAESDQGASTLAAWAAAPGGGTLALGASNELDVVAGALAGLEADTPYAFRFYGTNAYGSAWSGAGNVVTDLTGAQTPVIVAAAGTLRSVTVAWSNRAANATGFRLQWASPADPTTTVALAAGPFVQTPVAAGQTYRYRVGATNALNGSFSGYSAWTNATVPFPASGLLAYDLFSGANAGDATLDAQAYTTPDVAGVDGPWVRHGGNARTARNFNADAGIGPQPVGSNGALGGVWDTNPGWARECFSTRRLAPAAQIDLGRDGTYFLSFYGKSTGDSALNAGLATGTAADSRFFNAGLIWNNATSIGGAGGDANDKFYVGRGVLDGNTDNGLYGVRVFGDKTVGKDGRLFFVLRIRAQAAGNDTVDMAVYDAANPPESGPDAVAWVASHAFDSADVFTHLVFGFNGGGGLEFDGFRLGTDWAAVAGTLAEPSPVRALGFNFVGNTTVGDLVTGHSPGALATNELAGAPGCVQAFWNNLQTDWSGNGGAPAVITDSAGSAVAVTLEYDSANTWGTGIGAWAGNHRLMRGYIDDNQGDGSQPYLVVQGIPYARYRVVLYADNDNGVGTAYGSYWVEALDGTRLTPAPYMRSPYGCFAGAFLRGSTGAAAKATADYGNYLVFEGLTAQNIRIRGLTEGDTRAVINAVQLVDAAPPAEPGTILIVR